jgi:hypothetical protein
MRYVCWNTIVAVVAMALCLAARPTVAQEKPQETTQATTQDKTSAKASDAWRFEFIPYLWGTGVQGDAGVRGVVANVDVSFNDILNNTETAALFEFAAQKKRWLMITDALYLRLNGSDSDSLTGPFGKVAVNGVASIDATEQLYQFVGGYRVIDKKTKFDLLGGARYTNINPKINLVITTTSAQFPGGARTVNDTVDWTDPIIGARVVLPFAKKWTFVAYGDVGGFDANSGTSSDWTTQLLAGADWQINKTFSAKFGYRQLIQDYKKNGFVWDVTMKGPYGAVGIQF